jgi:hypothetical protein
VAAGRGGVEGRVARVDWAEAARSLDELGHARVPGLLGAAECRALIRLWGQEARFRKAVDLERQRFGGGGSYKYLAAPLPPLVAALRARLFPPLAAIANAWQAALGSPLRFPPALGEFLAVCRANRQTQPTPLLLRYRAGGYNRLHQDLYGAVAFPLQVTVLLSEPGRDFEGGEFLLVEQRARMQSRGEAVALRRGEAIVFPTRERPVRSARGVTRAQLRHGLSRVHRGERFALGIIFHDAK